MNYFKLSCGAFAVSTLIVIGCGGETPTEGNAAAHGEPIDGTPYLAASEPEGSVDVIKARKSAKDGEEIVVVGRIGGKRNPWLKGRAEFLITDSSLVPCNEIEGDNCKWPWDYCCASDLDTSRAMVSVVDEKGNVVKEGAKQLLNLKELQTVVVRGKAKRIDGGNLTILARQVYVKK